MVVMIAMIIVFILMLLISCTIPAVIIASAVGWVWRVSGVGVVPCICAAGSGDVIVIDKNAISLAVKAVIYMFGHLGTG